MRPTRPRIAVDWAPCSTSRASTSGRPQADPVRSACRSDRRHLYGALAGRRPTYRRDTRPRPSRLTSLLLQARQVTTAAVPPCPLGAFQVELDTAERRDDLFGFLAVGVRAQRGVDRGDLGRGAELLASGLEPLVVHVDGDACHGWDDTPRS